jgi:N-acyl-phosphatidylethanolamine-hydrolysing phospholipase D
MSFYPFKRFQNPLGGPKRNYNLFKWLTFFIRRLLDRQPSLPEDLVMSREDALKSYHQFQNENTLTWLGHATFLMKLNGTIILTDPFLTDYASPISGLGPKRFSPPGFSISDLPQINIIVVSHDHFDHLDVRTISALPNKADIHVVVPLRLGAFFKSLGFKLIHELEWHESWIYKDINIRALPAYHYSKRNLLTRNTRLWASYAITWQAKKIYFSGDTAYGSIFLDMGRDYGPFDYALLSIGAYDPPELMLTGHVSPELAVRIGQELRAKTLVAMHWGTIILSDEYPFEPPKRFLNAAISANYQNKTIWILKIGETRKI